MPNYFGKIKGRLRLRQLCGLDPEEIIVPFTVKEIQKLFRICDDWQTACAHFLGKIHNHPTDRRLEFLKKTQWYCLVL